jgi:hypothetical protein
MDLKQFISSPSGRFAIGDKWMPSTCMMLLMFAVAVNAFLLLWVYSLALYALLGLCIPNSHWGYR